MEAVQVVCPSGLFPLPAHVVSERLLSASQDTRPLQQQSQLLDQLQVLNRRVNRLLDVLSVQNQQVADDSGQDVRSLLEESCICILQSLQQAGAAKQPLLATSSQHASCFCRLLERAHMLDMLSNSGSWDFVKATSSTSGLPTAHHLTSCTDAPHTQGRDCVNPEQSQLVEQAKPAICDSACWISHLGQQLQALAGVDAVLAALVQHCQQNMAAGGKLITDLGSIHADGQGKAEVIDVTCLSSIQEQHSAARALPLLLRLYFSNSSRLETVAAGRPEPLSSKLLEKCLAQLVTKPVVPGHGEMPQFLPSGLDTCPGLTEAAAVRKLKLPAGLPTDTKSLLKLDQSYSLEHKVLPLLQQHDILCDLLCQLALEVRQSVAVDRDVDIKALGSAEQLVVGSINFVSAARNALLELHAWRCMQQQSQLPGGESLPHASAERDVLADSDIVPFIDILGVMKGLTGLVTDSHDWLQQLLMVHTVKQLQEFASVSLPALAKLYPRNERIQHLLRSALCSMQGQLVELTDEAYMARTPSAISSAPVTPTMDSLKCLEAPFQTAPGPMAEGFEGLKPRWGRRGLQQQVLHSEAHEIKQLEDVDDSVLQESTEATVAVAAEAAGTAERGISNILQQDQYQNQQQEQRTDDASEEGSQAACGQEMDALAIAQNQDGSVTADDALQQLIQQQQQQAESKRSWGNALLGSMRKGKHKPQPSPAPELCAAPAALTALEELLSGAEAECYAADAAAAADADVATFCSSAQAVGLGVRLHPNRALGGGHTQLGSTHPGDLGSMSSPTGLTAAPDQPQGLPWDQSSAGGGEEQLPGNVAAAAAAFERLAAVKRASKLSTPHADMAAAAPSAAPNALEITNAPDLRSSVLPAPHDLDPEELAAAAALELALAEEGGPEATSADLAAVCSSPHTARKFHLFKFKSLLQHHEKLSTTGTSDLLAAVEPSSSKQSDDAAVAAVELGAVARMRAVLSVRRRTSAVALASALLAALQQPADAGDTTAEDECCVAGVSSMPPSGAAAAAEGSAPCISLEDGADAPASLHGAADDDQLSKQGKVAGMMSRMISFRTQARGQHGQAAASGATGKGLKALNFTAKLKKVVERRQAGAGGLDSQCVLHLDAPPPLTCLLQLRVVLEQLMHEIKTETKKHLMVQLQMAAAAAAGGAGATPDASIARPLKQVKTMIKAVHSMQVALDYVRHLGEASDLAALWVSKACSSMRQDQQAAERVPAPAHGTAAGGDPPAVTASVRHRLLLQHIDQQPVSFGLQSPSASSTAPAAQQQPQAQAASLKSATTSYRCFPVSLLASCMCKLDSLPADLPLLAIHIFWDVRRMLKDCGRLDSYFQLLKQQEEEGLRYYMASLVPQVYEHFKRLAAHQTVTYEVLRSCNAHSLQPVRRIYLDALLQERCIIMLQGDYTTIAQAAEAELSQHAGVLAEQASTIGLAKWPGVVQHPEQQPVSLDNLQQALQQLVLQVKGIQGQQQEASADKGNDPGPIDHQQQPTGALPVSGSKLLSHASPQQLSPSKVAKQRKRHSRARQKAAADGEDSAAIAGASPAGLTPLMQKVEQLRSMKQATAAQQQQQMQELVTAEAASLLDVRQWLLAGLFILLKKDAADLVDRCRTADPMVVVEAQLQRDILQRAHQLISQYAPLPCSWQQLWQEADAMHKDSQELDSCESASAHSIADSLLQLIDTAAYDSEAQVLLPPAAADAASAACVEGVLGEVSAAVRPLRSFLGRQHLRSLLLLAGPVGQQYVLAGLLDKLDQEQEALLNQLQALQDQLPSALLRLPPAEQCHDAGSVLNFYQTQLSQAMSDSVACSAALDGLQRIGNCLALLHLMSMQQSVQATPVFMQAAPFLGVVGCPITDAAAAAECFEVDGLPPPPDCTQRDGVGCLTSCAPGLLMPEVERLEPNNGAAQAHVMQVGKELQQEQAWRDEAEALGVPFDSSVIKPGGDLARHRVWQNSYFQQLLLGSDADKVRGPALLLTQAAELAAWKATEAADYMGPCLQRVQLWATRLQQQLQGIPKYTLVDQPEEVVPTAADCNTAVVLECTAGNPTAGTPLPQDNLCHQTEHQRQNLAEVEVAAVQEGKAAGAAADVVASVVHDKELTQQLQRQQSLQMQPMAEQVSAAQPGQQAETGPTAATATAGSIAAVSMVRAAGHAKAHEEELASSGADHVNSAPLTADVLQPESSMSSCASMMAAAAVTGSNASSNLEIRTKPPGHLSTEDLKAAAEAAAVAASQPGSPQSGSLANPWEAAGAAAALLPAGSIPPAHAKLAYRALLDNTQQQDNVARTAEGQTVDRPLSGGSASGRCGLAELVLESLDVVTSARSDTEPPLSSRLLSSRQLQVQPQQGLSAGRGAECAEVSEVVVSPRRRRTRSRAGVGGGRDRTTSAGGNSKQTSPSKHNTGGLSPDLEGTTDDMNGSDHDVTDFGPANTSDSPHAGEQRSSRLGHLQTSGGVEEQAAAGTAAGSSCYAGPAPGRRPVPRLGLDAISPGGAPLRSGAEAKEGMHTNQLQQRLLAEDPAGQLISRPLRAAEGGASSDEACRAASTCSALHADTDTDAVVSLANTSRGSSYPEDELLDGTCAELMRVKMERDEYRSEIEVLKNQLKNQEQTITLLSGDFYTPRTTDCGSVLGGHGYLDKEHSTGAVQQHGYPSPGDLSSGGNMQLEANVIGKSLTEAGAAAGLAGKGSVSQLQGIPEVEAAEQLSPEQSDVQQEASKLSIRVQQPSPAGSAATAEEEDSSSSSACSSSGGPESEDSSTEFSSAAGKFKLPEVVFGSAARRGTSSSTANTAQLAVALSALKFALLLEAAKAPQSIAESAAAVPATGYLQFSEHATVPQNSPLKRLKKAPLSKVAGGIPAAGASSNAGDAVEQPIMTGALRTGEQLETISSHAASAIGKPAASSAKQYCGGSGRIAGGQYGDGPLLASAVLLQLSGQSRKHALLDATNRIAHWVEYDAVKGSGHTQGSATAASKGVAAGPTTPGGIDPNTADGIAPPEPRSKKRQEEQAEQEARLKQQQAAQQQLLQRLAAVARQADRVAHDGCSIAARFAPPAPAHSQKMRLRVYRADQDVLSAVDASAALPTAAPGGVQSGQSAAAEASSKWVRFSSTGSRARCSTASGAGSTPKQCATKAVPVRSEVLEFPPAVKPWAGLVPCNKPIGAHPQLPMPRPRPLLLPDHLTATAFKTLPAGAAAAGDGFANPAGRLMPSTGVTPAAGLVTAARAVHAREAMLAALPRAAVYSFSVMSDHNRSGRPDDGYSKAPSTMELDSSEGSPRKHSVMQHSLAAAAAAVNAGATRLGGRRAGAIVDVAVGGLAADQFGSGSCSGSEALSPSRSPTKSPGRRVGASGLRPDGPA